MVLECQVSLGFPVYLDSLDFPVSLASLDSPDFPVSLASLVYPDFPVSLDFLVYPDSLADLMVLLPTLNYLNDLKKSADTLYLVQYWSLSFS